MFATDVWPPKIEQYLLDFVDIQLTADLADYLEIGQVIAAHVDATKELIIDIDFELLDQTFVRATGIVLQEP